MRVNYGNPDAFEGDIGLDPETRAIINGQLTENQFKGVTLDRIWPGAQIPYVFDNNFDNRRRQLVNQAITSYNQHTCVRFVPRTNQRDFVHMVNEQGCWSIIGRQGNSQKLKLGDWCLDIGTAIHEMMHAAGFYHEQSRNDRDDHVVIFWNNIQRGEDYNFQKYRTEYYGQTYDHNSIMHYRNDEFSANGKNTIQAKNNPGLKLGNNQFSKSDIAAINQMYKCSGVTGITPAPCEDSHSNCAAWAKANECNKNPNWMRPNCKKSCGTCV
nr:zinc metalloproteinase nas-15-like isoform X1 [Hydra vulgaris]